MDFRVSYSLRQITDSESTDFAKAMIVYNNNIDPRIRTATSEIAYWLNNNNRVNEMLYCFALLDNNKICGYAQFMHFKDMFLIFFDYMAIDTGNRRGGTFHTFVDLIRDFMAHKNIEYDYILTEIGCFSNEEIGVDNNSVEQIRMYRRKGFKVAHVEYYQPKLGYDNDETYLQAKILVCPKHPETNAILKETYLKLIKTVYFRHYGTWYSNDPDKGRFENYLKHLTDIYEHTKIQIANIEKIELNGIKRNSNEKTDQFEPRKPEKDKYVLESMFVLFSISAIVIFLVRFSSYEQKNISVWEIIALLACVAICFIAIVAIRKKEAHGVLKTVQKLVLELFRSKKDG